MARLFPPTLDDHTPTPGERRVHDVLRRVLGPDRDHWAWYEPEISVARGKRPEPDFVVLGPRYGVVVLEVKDWGRDAFVGGSASRILVRAGDGRDVKHTHPLKQAERYAYALRERFERTEGLAHASGKYRGKPVLPVNWGVVYPNLTHRDLETLEAQGIPLRPSHCLLREDLDRDDEEGARLLLAALERLCDVCFPFTLDERIRERVRVAIEPQLHFFDLRRGEEPATPPAEPGVPVAEPGVPVAEPATPATRAPLPRLEGFMLDDKQTRIARLLASPRTLVYGPAGSGKTVFLVARAHYWRERMPEARVLYTCYNASLASHLRHVFALKGLTADDDRLTVIHYHDLCGRILGSQDIHERTPEFYRTVEPKVLQELSRRDDVPLYDCILVDEGQDFSQRMIEVLVRLCADGGEITVVCDPAQDIYGRWTEDNLAPMRGYERERLIDCYRNTAPIFALALAVLPEETRREMGLDRLELTRPEDVGRVGPAPELRPLPGLDDLAELIVGTARAFDAARRPLSELAVLYHDRHAIPNFPGRLRHASWEAARDPRFLQAPDEDGDGTTDDTEGTLQPDAARNVPIPSDRPHFAEALERELVARGAPARWVARDFESKASYDISEPALTICTVHSAKGMDFHTVILLGADALSTREGTERERSAALLFTGITRARERLVMPFFLDRKWVPALRAGIEDIEGMMERWPAVEEGS